MLPTIVLMLVGYLLLPGLVTMGQPPPDNRPRSGSAATESHVVKDGWTRQASPLPGQIPITQLPSDGLLVTKHGEVRAIAGKWKVLVTMDTPRAPTELKAEIDEVARVIVSAAVATTTRQAWRRRLNKILISLPSISGTTPAQSLIPGQVRKPRGLLDPLGVLMHDIFGLATTAEVNNIKRVLQTVDTNQAAIVTQFDILTTVVNRSRVFEQENREFLNKLSSQFRDTQRVLYNLTRSFSLLTLRVNMEQVLEDLELQADNIQQFHNLYAHRRQDLHNLRLSETPPCFLP